jgi:hypothetical protein
MYHVSGSAELVSQHCKVPNLSNMAHLKELTKALEMSMAKVSKTSKGRKFIWKLQGAIDAILHPPVRNEQRVDATDSNPPAPVNTLAVPITRISYMPAIMQTHDPMANQQLIETKHAHQSQTQNNTPGGVPAIMQDSSPTLKSPKPSASPTQHQSKRLLTPHPSPIVTFTPVPGGVQASTQLVSQQALKAMTINEALHAPDIFTPRPITCKSYKNMVPNNAHFMSPMVHPMTGETITSYKCLMHNPKIAEV